MRWTYDLRGLDEVQWLARAANDLRAHRSAHDGVTLLVTEQQALSLADALTRAGYVTRQAAPLGVVALEVLAQD